MGSLLSNPLPDQDINTEFQKLASLAEDPSFDLDLELVAALENSQQVLALPLLQKMAKSHPDLLVRGRAEQALKNFVSKVR